MISQAAKAQVLSEASNVFFGKRINDTLKIQLPEGSNLRLKTNKEVYCKETLVDTVELSQVIRYFPDKPWDQNFTQFPGVPGEFNFAYD